jgi:hypothetical protein
MLLSILPLPGCTAAMPQTIFASVRQRAWNLRRSDGRSYEPAGVLWSGSPEE